MLLDLLTATFIFNQAARSTKIKLILLLNKKNMYRLRLLKLVLRMSKEGDYHLYVATNFTI
jgi:hypothetical protein